MSRLADDRVLWACRESNTCRLYDARVTAAVTPRTRSTFLFLTPVTFIPTHASASSVVFLCRRCVAANLSERSSAPTFRSTKHFGSRSENSTTSSIASSGDTELAATTSWAERAGTWQNKHADSSHRAQRSYEHMDELYVTLVRRRDQWFEMEAPATFEK